LGFVIWDLAPRQCPKKAKATRGRVRTPKVPRLRDKNTNSLP
jgi:hypothetical protein